MAKTRSHRRRHHKKKTCGGDYKYTESVVGPYPHSAQGGTNLIAQHVPVLNQAPVTGGSALSPGLVNAPLPAGAPPAYNVQVTTPGASTPLVGGKKNMGGNVLSELAVPAVLLIANQKFGKRKSYKGKKSGYKGKRFSSRRRRNRF